MSEAAIITGGCGFVGRKLSEKLLADQLVPLVILYDITPPKDPLQQGEQYVQGSTLDQQLLERCLQQHAPSIVFHIAAYGMSGAASLDKANTWESNVLGTKSVLAACVAVGVPRLVYTSTCNVVFGGQPIRGGDESLPYFPPHKQLDYYSSSKTVAEMIVLAANGTPLAAAADGKGNSSVGCAEPSSIAPSGSTAAAFPEQQPRVLRTCALRPNGIYGAGEVQHSVRLLQMAEKGMLLAKFGPPDAVQDWTHIDNLIQAQVLAAASLTEAKGHIAAGQAYFIVDPEPADSQAFLAPLLEGLGYRMPTVRVPYWLIYGFVSLCEMLYYILPKWLGYTPMFTRNEIRKASVTHYFSTEKARRELGYNPQQRSAADYLPWFIERGYGVQNNMQALLNVHQ